MAGRSRASNIKRLKRRIAMEEVSHFKMHLRFKVRRSASIVRRYRVGHRIYNLNSRVSSRLRRRRGRRMLSMPWIVIEG